MYLRPKTKRRLLILGTTFALILGLVATGFVVHAKRTSAQIAQSRLEAMAAHEAGDHPAALEAFAFYLDESKTADKGAEADSEAILAYAKSRAAVEAEGGRHLWEAAKILDLYMRLKPGDAEARRMLLGLQPRLNLNFEALELADAALAEDPADADALWARVRALANQARQDRGKYPEAVNAAKRLNEAAPLDLRAQVQTLHLMLLARRPDGEVIGRAEELRQQHKDDPRFDLLLAMAYALTRQPEPAAAWLRTAASHEAPDAAFALDLARQLELFSLFPLAGEVIERAAKKFPDDPELTRALAWLLWRGGRHEEVVLQFPSLDASSRKTDPTLLALHALSLHALGRDAEADAISKTLAQRTGDRGAAAWAAVLAAELSPKPVEPREMVSQCRAALEKDPQNPVVHFLLGRAFERMGEPAMATSAWQQSAALAPAWAAPHAAIARLMIDASRYQEAVRAAEAAYRRSPRDLAIAADWIVANYGALTATPRPDEAALASLLKNVAAVQKEQPGEPRTLPIYAALLAQTGDQDAAAGVARKALETQPPHSPETLTRLGIVSRSHGLGLEEELFDRVAQAPDLTPAAALRLSVSLAEGGQREKALTAFTNARAKSRPLTNDNIQWTLAQLQLHDLLEATDTLPGWIRLCDAHPQTLAIQTAALRSPARLRDHAFWQRVVDRVEQLTGPDAQLWQIEQARLTLSAATSEEEIASTIALLEGLTKRSPDAAEPHRLLALAFERHAAGLSPTERAPALNRAVEEITRAAEIAPSDAAVTRDVVRLFRRSGKAAAAVQHLDRFIGSAPYQEPAIRIWVAQAYLELGEVQKATDLLASAPNASHATASMLAALHQRAGRLDEAARLYRTLLDIDQPDPRAIVEAAIFFAGQGEMETAEALLARLDRLGLPAGDASVFRAKASERSGDLVRAAEQYRAATAKLDAGAAPWRELAGFQLRQRRFNEAAADAEKGLSKWPHDALLKSLLMRARELASLPPDVVPQVLADLLSVDPESAGAQAMLSAITEAHKTNASPENTVAGLMQAAERFPEFLPLQLAAIGGQLEVGNLELAEPLARRTVAANPGEPEALRMLTAVYAARGEWAKARDVALLWRRLTPADPRGADVALAEAELETADPAGAADRLQPYVKADSAASDPLIISLYARALITGGRTEEAGSLLEPLVKRDAAWASVWMKLTLTHGDADAAAHWLSRLNALLPETAPRRLELAAAWYEAGQHFAARPLTERAAVILSEMPTDAGPEVWMLRALCAQSLGDYSRAVAAHQKVLEANPALPEAKNNLAYALVLRGHADDLSQARQLAESAVAAREGSPTFHDTLARVELKAGQPEAAERHFRKALEADPQSVEARIGLAESLLQSRRKDDARAVVRELDQRLKKESHLPVYLAEQLTQVRQAIKATPVPIR